jgi:hypothetical protein
MYLDTYVHRNAVKASGIAGSHIISVMAWSTVYACHRGDRDMEPCQGIGWYIVLNNPEGHY